MNQSLWETLTLFPSPGEVVKCSGWAHSFTSQVGILTFHGSLRHVPLLLALSSEMKTQVFTSQSSFVSYVR